MPLIQSRPSLSLHHQSSNTNKSGSIPDLNSVPHLSSPSRSFSVGHYPSPQTSPNSKTTFAPSNSNVGQLQPQQQSTPVSTGKTTFRSFRNLLPFGPGKLPASPNTSSSFVLTPNRSFSLGQRPAKEKEKGGDKKLRSPIPNLPDLPNPQKPPVLVIQNAPSPPDIGTTTSPYASVLSSLPPQLPPLRLQSETQQSAPLISITLPFPTPASTPSPASASPSRTDHGTLPLSTSSIPRISDATDNPSRGDLSTIVESETSALSISKHIPTLVEEDPVDDQPEDEQEDVGNPSRPLLNELNSRNQVDGPHKGSRHTAPGSPTASMTLELSTSHLAEIAAEVRNAMSVGGGQNEAWLASVVVEEASEPKIDPGSGQGGDTEEDPNRLGVGSGLGDVSFNFHTLDPELAALLSPNKIVGGNVSRSGSTERLSPSPSPNMRIQRIPDEGLSPSLSPNLLSASSRSKGSPVPPPDNLPLLAESPQLSPQLPQPKRIFSSTKPHSPTHIPRPSLSSNSTATPSPSSTKPCFPRSNASGSAESSSADATTPDRRPSTSLSHPSVLRPSSPPIDPEDQAYAMGRGSVDRRPGSKLGPNTPFKTSTLHNLPSSRPALRQLSTPNGPWDPETVSPSSRMSSSLGIAGRRQFAPRPSLDSARPSFERPERLERPSPQSQPLSQGRVRNRNRSMSESTGSPELARQLSSQPNSGSLHRRAIDFTGPRTARLFREAGLLPKDRDRERDRDEEAPSRQTSPIYSRSSMDRERVGDYHRQMAPSRTGYSEISTTSSTWGRTRPSPSIVSERVGTPFTSSSSTAPTSATSSLPPLSLPVSSALQQQREDATAYQVLREKHQMETEALLSALSDSQNLNKILREENVRMREENAQLRERLVVLEETIEVMRRERERERERERLNGSRSHSRNQSAYGSSSRPRMSRFASSEHVGIGRTASSLEGVYKRSYVSAASRPHTTYFSHGDEFVSDIFPLKGGSRAGSRLGMGSTLGSELDLVSPESSPGEVVGHRRISPDHRATFMDDRPARSIVSHTRNGSDHDHRDRVHSIANGFGLGHGHPSRRFEAGMEKAKAKGASGLGGRRAVSDTLSQRSLRESSSRPHSRPDIEDEQEDDEDETQRGFGQLSRKSSRHLRTHSITSSVFGVPPSNMSMLMHSSPNSDDEGSLGEDETRRDLRPHPSPTFIFKKTQTSPHVANHGKDVSTGNVSNVSPTTVNFSMSQPGSPGSLRLSSDHEDHLGDMESLHFDGEFDDLS
ncbi:hypothetical protein BDM02DRAFT_3188027 [Thelephora ganbajun]|uniref:Uncharacterized protein n=1 Tax=Thelephora ganbajun TaxID=370292 RepID=A0ACB6ZCP1_THEGA|nr:hypothetical protein BDM02DRAFT_3188027 [Thelephora ganbajun]